MPKKKPVNEADELNAPFPGKTRRAALVVSEETYQAIDLLRTQLPTSNSRVMGILVEHGLQSLGLLAREDAFLPRHWNRMKKAATAAIQAEENG